MVPLYENLLDIIREKIRCSSDNYCNIASGSNSIDILLLFGINSCKFFPVFYETAMLLSSGKHKINWKGITVGGNKEMPAVCENLGHLSLGERKKRPAVVHCAGLDLLKQYCTSHLSLLAHVDLCILKRGWDDVMISEVSKDDIGAIGVGANIRPSVIFTLIRSDILRKVDFSLNVDKKTILNEEEAKVICPMLGVDVNIGEYKLDGGWRVPVEIHNSGMKSIIFSNKTIKDFRKLHKKFHRRSYMYQLHVFNKKYMLSHFGKSIKKDMSEGLVTLWIKNMEQIVEKFGV